MNSHCLDSWADCSEVCVVGAGRCQRHHLRRGGVHCRQLGADLLARHVLLTLLPLVSRLPSHHTDVHKLRIYDTMTLYTADYFLMSSSSFLACNSWLRSAIRRHHPPQRAVLSRICCFGECKMVTFQILLDGAELCDAGTTQLSSPVCRRGGQQDHLGICVVVHAHNMPK